MLTSFMGMSGVTPIVVTGTQRIMYLGTSTTDGLGDNSFREPAQTALDAAFPEVTFTHVGGEGSAPWNHEGIPGGGMSGIGASVAADIATYTPDIISIMIGENDVDIAGAAYDPVLTPGLFRTLLENIRAADSDVQIVVTPPTIPDPDDVSADIVTYRANLADLVPKMIQIAREFSCIVEDTYTWSQTNLVTADFDDDVHHSTLGKAKLGPVVALGVGEAVGRNLAPASYVTPPEIVTLPSLSGNITEGNTVTAVAGIVDAFPQVVSTSRILVDGVEVGTNSYTFDSDDVGASVVVEQTAGGDVETSADLGPVAADALASLPAGATYALEARAGVTESAGLASAMAGQYGTTASATASGTERPDYLATSGMNGGPALRFGAPSANGDDTLMAMSEDLRAAAGDFCVSALVNPSGTLGTQQWILGFASLYGALHIRSSAESRPSWYDGAYRNDGAAPAQTGWQLLTFVGSGTTLTIYRGRTQIGTATLTPQALTSGTLGNVSSGGFPLDGLWEALYAWPSVPTLSELFDFAQQEFPGAAP